MNGFWAWSPQISHAFQWCGGLAMNTEVYRNGVNSYVENSESIMKIMNEDCEDYEEEDCE